MFRACFSLCRSLKSAGILLRRQCAVPRLPFKDRASCSSDQVQLTGSPALGATPYPGSLCSHRSTGPRGPLSGGYHRHTPVWTALVERGKEPNARNREAKHDSGPTRVYRIVSQSVPMDKTSGQVDGDAHCLLGRTSTNNVALMQPMRSFVLIPFSCPQLLPESNRRFPTARHRRT